MANLDDNISVSEAKDIEERLLILRVLRGDEKAKNELLKSYMPFIDSIVSSFLIIDLEEDLSQQGLLGFSQALTQWDQNSNYRLRDLCYWAIKCNIIEYVFQNWSEEIRDDFNDEAYFTIAGNMTDDRRDLDKFAQLKKQPFNIEFINDALVDHIKLKPDYVKKVVIFLLKTFLAYGIQRMLPFEQKVIGFKYGLIDGQFHTTSTLSQILDKTESEIREIEIGALQKAINT